MGLTSIDCNPDNLKIGDRFRIITKNGNAIVHDCTYRVNTMGDQLNQEIYPAVMNINSTKNEKVYSNEDSQIVEN